VKADLTLRSTPVERGDALPEMIRVCYSDSFERVTPAAGGAGSVTMSGSDDGNLRGP
jgi:hypothetical protein